MKGTITPASIPSYDVTKLLQLPPVVSKVGTRIVSPDPGVIAKVSAMYDISEEVVGTQFAYRHGLPVPYIFNHSPVSRTTPYVRQVLKPSYIAMQHIPGVPLSDVLDGLSVEDLERIAYQLKDIVGRLRKIRPPKPWLGSVTGGPYRNNLMFSLRSPKHAFSTCGEFVDYYRDILMLFCTESFTESLLARLPRNAPIVFTHGDFGPTNIMVDGSTVTGIIDWECAGFYPEYFERARMCDPAMAVPNWKHITQLVFPEPQSMDEVSAMCKVLSTIAYNLG